MAEDELVPQLKLPTPPNPLSKNAQKKQLKKERLAIAKAEKKLAKKEAKRQRVDEQASNPQVTAATTAHQGESHPAKRRKLTQKSDTSSSTIVIIDLGFDELMLEKEVASLCNQLSFVYASNRRASLPFCRVVCTGLNGQTLAKLESTGDGTAFRRWKDVSWFSHGYEDFWTALDAKGTLESDALEARLADRERVVYLTADSSEELEELSEDNIYVLGGICDHNRYKNLCLGKAEKQSIRTAHLPIGSYMAELQTRKVLTINQVFDIMLGWVEHKDWRKAFESVVPKRKLKSGKPVDSTAQIHPPGAEDTTSPPKVDECAE